MTTRRAFWLLLAALGFGQLALPRAAGATTVVPTTVEAMARRADAVVVAVPRRTHSYWAGRFIVTDVELEVQSVARGALAVGAHVMLELPGGVVGRVGQQVPGVPAPAVGTPYVFFLARAGAAGAFRLAHFTAGVLPLTLAPDGGVTVRPAAEGLLVQRAGTGPTAGEAAATAMTAEGLRLEALFARLRSVR